MDFERNGKPIRLLLNIKNIAWFKYISLLCKLIIKKTSIVIVFKIYINVFLGCWQWTLSVYRFFRKCCPLWLHFIVQWLSQVTDLFWSCHTFFLYWVKTSDFLDILIFRFILFYYRQLLWYFYFCTFPRHILSVLQKRPI